MRLMPLGIGYRYAGRGVWFDGVRQDATLNFEMHSAVQHTVVKQSGPPGWQDRAHRLSGNSASPA
jgi:hypothetical protein